MFQFSPPSRRHTAFLVFTYASYSTYSWLTSFCPLFKINSVAVSNTSLTLPFPLPFKSSLSINDFLLGSCTTKFIVLRLLSFFLLSLPFAGLSSSLRPFHYILFFLTCSNFLNIALSVLTIKSVVQFNVHPVTTDSKQLVTNRQPAAVSWINNELI